MQTFRLTKAGFGYVNSVSLQTDDAGHVGAAVLAHVAYVVTERGLTDFYLGLSNLYTGQTLYISKSSELL